MLSKSNCKSVVVCALCLVMALLCAPARAQEGEGMHWVTAWGTSQQPNVTEATINNATIRLIARVTLPGDTIRIRLDNTFASQAVTIGKVFVAHRVQGALVAEGSSRQVFWNGSASVTIPAGGGVQSDAVALKVYAWQDIAVSLYVPGTNVHPSQHGGAVVTSYVTAPGSGDFTADETRTPFTGTITSTYWLKSVDVLSPLSTQAVVAFGDSITDGTCTTLDAHDRWEDWVAVRLDVANAPAPWVIPLSGPIGSDNDRRSVVNEGIGGNTITRQNLQPPPDSTPGVERLDRDVLSHSGVSHVVLFMGTNDIRREASAAQVMAGMENIIQRVKAKGLKIYGVTIIPRHNVPPSGTNTGWNPAKTAIRNTVNQWIRTVAPFDAVLDFDKVVRQPANPDLLVPAFNCGDGIHPSPAGYYQMVKSVDLNLFDGHGPNQ
jgi:lysophospholipase L1-like esterase